MLALLSNCMLSMSSAPSETETHGHSAPPSLAACISVGIPACYPTLVRCFYGVYHILHVYGFPPKHGLHILVTMPEEEPLRAPTIRDIHLLVDDPARRRQVQALLEPPREAPLRTPIKATTVANVHLLVEDPEQRRYAQYLSRPSEEIGERAEIQRQEAEERRRLAEEKRQQAEEKHRLAEEKRQRAEEVRRKRAEERRLRDEDKRHARSLLQNLRRQRADEQARQRQDAPRRNIIKVSEAELARTMAAVERQRAAELIQARAVKEQARVERRRADEEPVELDEVEDEITSRSDRPRIKRPRIEHPRSMTLRTEPPRTEPPRTEHLRIPRIETPGIDAPRIELRRSDPLPTPPPSKPLHVILQLQQKLVDTILQHYESSFRGKEEASVTRTWCQEVPLAMQVQTAKSFYQAFTDEKTLSTSHCVFCYRKFPPRDLTAVQWRSLLMPSLLQATSILQKCRKCLPLDDDAQVNVCGECHAALGRGNLPKACSVNNIYIGCEHRYPRELDGLSPVEERLIALQAPFGYITKFTVDNKTPSGPSYRKHVKGHIVVFPNKVEDLVATVLPHPLLETVENIHVSWSGPAKPGPADVGQLLQVRKSRVRAALSWLRQNNPLYQHITINHAEIDSWRYVEGSSVPALIMESMQREEPSAAEKTQTDHIVPDTDRGWEENRFTSIEELVTSVQPRTPDGPCLLAEQLHRLPDEPAISDLGPEPTDRDGDDAVYETSSSGMFPLDGPAAFAEADKLSFLADAFRPSQSRSSNDAQPRAIEVQTAGHQPYIRVECGTDFADTLHQDFFPRTFPKLFPWGKGGPKALSRNPEHAFQSAQRHSNHSLTYWARYVLQRHGGRFATHPVFCFLVFNILLRSSNRRISMVRMTKGSFARIEQIYRDLTADRLKRAEDEIRETRATSDYDISSLLRELSIFGHAQPLSNETRLLMRRKIQSLCIWTGTPVIWFTINPNDVNNPVKMRLSIHRLHDYDTAKQLLADLRGKYDRVALSTMDPVSSAIFFHREVSLFFDRYVSAGRESIFGKVSHYYATVETNDRGSLHLHGLLWLHGNMQLPSLIEDVANPEENEYRAQVVRYLDSVFHECLDEDAGKAIRRDRKPIHPLQDMMHSSEALSADFDAESNYIAYCCQVHSHTYTCIKYSLKGLKNPDSDTNRRTTCRFKAPWKIVQETAFKEDGLVSIRRNHPLVNRYNKAMAVGLRHNHDVSMILTRTKGLAMVYYITNYATKLDTPMWRRVVHAAEVRRQLRESADVRRQASDPTTGHDTQRPAVLNESRQFLMRVANRVFSERQLSAVEVCYHLLGYQTDFTNVPRWSFLNLSALYWSIFRQWPHLRRQAGIQTDAEEPTETVQLREGGRTLLYLDAYAHRGRLLRSLCLYDYMSMVSLVRRQDRVEDDVHIALDGPSPECDRWIQKLRRPPEYAVPIFQGFISDDHMDEHPVYFKRYALECAPTTNLL